MTLVARFVNLVVCEGEFALCSSWFVCSGCDLVGGFSKEEMGITMRG